MTAADPNSRTPDPQAAPMAAPQADWTQADWLAHVERLHVGQAVVLLLLSAGEVPPKIIPAELPQPASLTLPYDLYTDEDIAHRVLYVEASRGCPFTCEFCLSSLDIPVRAFPLESFLAALERLLARKGSLSFVQIGANDGVSFDPMNPFVQRHRDRVSGIVVEPLLQAVDHLLEIVSSTAEIGRAHV